MIHYGRYFAFIPILGLFLMMISLSKRDWLYASNKGINTPGKFILTQLIQIVSLILVCK